MESWKGMYLCFDHMYAMYGGVLLVNDATDGAGVSSVTEKISRSTQCDTRARFDVSGLYKSGEQ